MGLAAQISAEMKLFMQEWGFRKRGNFFFKIKNDLAFCVYLEQPTGLVYSGFCVMPLYLPAESRYLTYGDRLNAFSPCPVGPLPVDGDTANGLNSSVLPWQNISFLSSILSQIRRL